MSRWEIERSLIVQTSLKLVGKGMVVGKAGNISQRVIEDGNTDLLAITPTSTYYESLSADDIAIVDFDGNLVEGNLPPSSETKLHIAIYKARKDVGAVVHTHSVYASAASVAALGIPAILEEEVALLGGNIRVAEYAPSGSQELAQNAVEALGDRNAVIMANHGALGVGMTLRDALDSCDLLEKAAQVYLLALSAGRVNPLSSEAVAQAKLNFDRLRKT